MKKLLLTLFIVGALASCNDADDSAPSISNLTLNLSGLENLGSDYVYEGWVVVDGFGPISSGQFSDASIQMVDNLASFSGVNPGPPIPGEDFFMPPPSRS